ncbi:hypothetical protein EDB95_4982 [Dinghuibacter silviterrae]|uniref:Uncharacterized protein n=2 Tax=Dinghuibacter silviterrae TaxID=1539049 RepID=A0A4R8DHE7_9BACT|nr:hypothetical protein EDB95_4982 [Dinghuibacter silviterrae]
MPTPTAHHKMIANLTAHLMEVTQAFNDRATQIGLPVRLDETQTIEHLKNGLDLQHYVNFWKHTQGVMRVAYIRTAVDCIYRLWKNDRIYGHVSAAWESSRMTSSLALQWAGPALYLLTGKKILPLLLMNNSSKARQRAELELFHFFQYYGKLALRRTIEPDSQNRHLDLVFDTYPSLNSYRSQVLPSTENSFAIPGLDQIDDPLHVSDSVRRKLLHLYKQTIGKGYHPLLVIRQGDEQKKRPAIGNNTTPAILRIFSWIGAEFGPQNEDFRVIGFSPPALADKDLLHIWQVKQVRDITSPQPTGKT